MRHRAYKRQLHHRELSSILSSDQFTRNKYSFPLSTTSLIPLK